MKTNETNTTTAIAAQSTKSTVLLSIDKIHPNPNNPRRSYDENALAELAASIATHGLIQPIRVRAAEQGGYIIVCGERRYRAVQLLGQTEIEAIVDAAPADERAIFDLALSENIQREDLNAIEEAQGVNRLMNECALTQEAVAERLGRSRSAIANLLRLLNLPARIQSAVIDGTLSAGHARVLAGIADSELQGALFAKTLQFGWSVRQLEAAAKNAQTEKKEKPEREPLPIEYEELTERLRSATGLKVKLEGTQEKGKITLQYTSEEELQRLWEWMER